MPPLRATSAQTRVHGRRNRMAWLVPVVVAACAGSPSGGSPGRLDEAQLARCRAAAEAFASGAEDYEALRDGLREDPVAAKWFVRYLEAELVRAREGRAEVTGQGRVQAQVGERSDLSDRLSDLVATARSRDAANWRLLEERPGTRAAAEIVAFGELAVPVVIADLLTSSQEFLRVLGTELMVGFGDLAVPHLLAMAKGGSPSEQRYAAKALGEIGPAGPALDALRELARSPEWRVRSDAAQALHKGGADARDLLVQMLGDEDPFVRKKAAETLAGHRDAASGAVLVDFLERSRERKDFDDERAAQQALQLLAGTRGPRSVDAWRAFVARLATEEGR